MFKFQHPQVTWNEDEASFALRYLHYLFPMIRQNSVEASDTIVQEKILEHKDKAAGFPWFALGACTKKEAFEKFTLEQLEDYYRDNTSIISSTLKDELRPINKDARFFRPQDVSSYIEGVRLFHHQNEYMCKVHKSPLFLQFVTPGRDLPYMFSQLSSFSSNMYAADGSAWDANFPLFASTIIATFRAQGFEGEKDERIARYYQMMYDGYTNVGGHLLNLVGNPSGHHNTSVDNALLHCILMAIHAYRSGIPIEYIEQELFFRVCGDDLVYASRDKIFEPRKLSETYSSLGVYLEFESLEPQQLEDLSFCGVSPFFRNVNGTPSLMYVLSGKRAEAALVIDKKKRTPVQLLAKIASIAQLLFADETRFKIAVKVFHRRLTDYVDTGQLSLFDVNVVGLLRSIEPTVLLRQYLCWEAVPFFRLLGF